jgi:hypothetical protein
MQIGHHMIERSRNSHERLPTRPGKIHQVVEKLSKDNTENWERGSVRKALESILETSITNDHRVAKVIYKGPECSTVASILWWRLLMTFNSLCSKVKQ